MNCIEVLPIQDIESNRPLWSVVIPTYNCASFLKETIQSVLIQDRGIENMEIWVVDDCSIDNPKEIVEQIGKGRIKFFRQEQNVGQLNNFSTCLNLAKGKIIHLLHGDDFVHKGFYESLEKPLTSDDSIGAAFTGNNIVDENSKVILTSDSIASKPGIIEDFLSIITSRQVIQTPSIVVKREVYENIGAFNKELSWVEDWEMWIRIASRYKFFYDPCILASYRIHNRSNTQDSASTGRFIKDVLNCIKIYSGYVKMDEKQKKKNINLAKTHFMNFAIQQSREKSSVLILMRSFPLIHSFSSLFTLINQLPRILLKSLLMKRAN